jgi:hypothetical protein
MFKLARWRVSWLGGFLKNCAHHFLGNTTSGGAKENIKTLFKIYKNVKQLFWTTKEKLDLMMGP